MTGFERRVRMQLSDHVSHARSSSGLPHSPCMPAVQLSMQGNALPTPTVQAPGLLVPHAAASSQHGFTVKASIPPIKEATQAEEHGDGGSLATTGTPPNLWRFSHSTAAAGRGTPASDDIRMGRSGGAGGGSMPSLAQLHIVRPAQQEDQQRSAGSPTVEVVGLHSSKGTRRLVKAVVRGLRACQVGATWRVGA